MSLIQIIQIFRNRNVQLNIEIPRPNFIQKNTESWDFLTIVSINLEYLKIFLFYETFIETSLEKLYQVI